MQHNTKKEDFQSSRMTKHLAFIQSDLRVAMPGTWDPTEPVGISWWHFMCRVAPKNTRKKSVDEVLADKLESA